MRGDFDALYPACVAMYEEEIGVSPEIAGGREMYRARVLQLITRGWSFARFEAGRVVFKAEVACVSPSAAQVQGVWVPPDRRGEGLATSGMAAVVEAVRRDIAPTVSLYVNEWNGPARRVYERIGFRGPHASRPSCSDPGADPPRRYGLPMTAAKDVTALAGIFAVSGTLHLVRPEVYEPIMPDLVPRPREVIYASGVAELLCAVGLLHPRTRRLAGWASAALLLVVYPANFQMAADAARSRSPRFKAVAFGRLPLQLPMIRAALRAART